MTAGRDDVALTVNSLKYSGWERVSVIRSIETIASAFELVVAERWPGQQASFAIKSGDACSLTIGKDVVITGYVDVVAPGYDEESHDISVKGRDATGDLVDCSIAIGAVNMASGPAINLIQQICQPFGIKVTTDVPQAQTLITTPYVMTSEAAFEAISRICEQSGLLPVSDGRGGINLTNAGSAGGRAAVMLGKNILKARGFDSMEHRFSTITVAQQIVALDNIDLTSATTMQGVAKDPNVTRHRPLIILADLSANGSNYFQQRAQWEQTVRLGRAYKPTVTVRGWRDDAGALWAPNTIVRLKDEWLACDRDLLISAVKYTLDDDSGTLAELTLTLPQAFAAAPIPAHPTMDNVGGRF